MSEQRSNIFKRALILVASVGLLVGTNFAVAEASPQVSEAPSVSGSPSAITYTGSSSVPAAVPAPAPVPAPTPAPAATPAPAPSRSAPSAAPAPQASGPLAFEQQLERLHYDAGAIDGQYDAVTRSAVVAFQKVHGMERTGEVTADVAQAVMAANGMPAPLVPGGGANRVEIDLSRQVLFLYEGDALFRILPVSSGNGERFCEGGRCRHAVTPTGDFQIYRQGEGWETGPLGSLYNPQYFEGGVAIHGSKSVPAEPASHGCVRIPMSAAEWFPGHVSIGTPVFVR